MRWHGRFFHCKSLICKFLGLGHHLNPLFLAQNVRTYCQLYGANVCFTDMTKIVRNRVAQFPCRFNLAHVWNSLQVLGIDAVRASSMVDTVDDTPLLDIYRTALTSEIMDSKQSEYYSDYAIYSVSVATESDQQHNKQPDPSNEYDAESVRLHEAWFYEAIHLLSGATRIIRFALRPTDDQKQVVTGGPCLYNRFISDDCETSASFLLGVHKTFMVIRAYFIHYGAWDDANYSDSAYFAWNPPADMITRLTGYDDDPAKEHTQWYSSEAEARNLVKALGNILRQYHLDVELCVGSASAASLGAKARPSGHCFAMLDAEHKFDPMISKTFILEGTNWITQRSLMGVHGGTDPDVNEQVTKLATIMMELTKHFPLGDKILLSTKNGVDKDHGKALSMVQERCSSAFWRAIYAKVGRK
jgi:hypothetical protein